MEFITLFVGVFLGWAITHIYHLKGGKEQKAEFEEQRRMNELMMRAMESNGSVIWSRDPEGKITGITHQLSATCAAVTVTGHRADLVVTPPEPRQSDDEEPEADPVEGASRDDAE